MLSREWEEWTDKRANDSLDIINFGIINFDYRHQRPQHLATNLGEAGNRVFYIESDFSYSPFVASAYISAKKIALNVYVIKLSAPRNYFIYRDQMSKQGQAIIMESLKKLFRQARIINPVAKIDHPFWGQLAGDLTCPVVYDAMDLHLGFAESGGNIAKREKSLVKQSDLVIASTPYIAKYLELTQSKSLILPNASDIAHFSTTGKKYRKPVDLASLPGRLFGYYGALAQWLDLDIIEAVARAFPSDSLVLIGRIQNNELINLAKKYKNIHLLGEKSYQELPKYLYHFDVALIPFVITPLIEATDPVKIYEYLAAGKSVVSTHIPELSRYGSLIYRASSPKIFIAKIKQALTENSSLARERVRAVRHETWDMRAKVLQARLKTLAFPKVSVVILTYNNAKLSEISVDSVIERSKYGNLEVIVVDNNSDQETVAMLAKYKGRKGIKLKLNKVNYGFAKGNNIGMKMATGEYIVLLNNDVRVTPGWIERLVSHARNNPKIGLVGPVTNSIGNESKITIEYDWDNATEIEQKSADYTYAHWGGSLVLRNIAAFAWLSPRFVYKKLGGLDERFGRGLFEDDDYCVRVKKAGLTILCAEDSFVHHYGGASTNWGSPEYQKLFNTNKEKFERKWKTVWIPHKYRQGVK